MPEHSILQILVTPTGQLTPEEKDAITDLCTRAFGEDFSSLFHFVQSSDHVRAFLEGRLVGHAVWSTRWFQAAGGDLLRTAYLDAVATDPAYWRRGVGRAVVRRLAEETAGYDLRGLSTDVPAFYERIGWTRWLGQRGARKDGSVLLTPDDIVMIQPTPLTPPLDLHALLTVEWRDGQPW